MGRKNLIDYMRKRFLLAGVSKEYRALSNYAEDSDTHLFGEEVEESLKKAKARHFSLQALKPEAQSSFSSGFTPKRKSTGYSKNERPVKRPMIGQTGNHQNQVLLSACHPPKKHHKKDHSQGHHNKGRN